MKNRNTRKTTILVFKIPKMSLDMKSDQNSDFWNFLHWVHQFLLCKTIDPNTCDGHTFRTAPHPYVFWTYFFLLWFSVSGEIEFRNFSIIVMKWNKNTRKKSMKNQAAFSKVAKLKVCNKKYFWTFFFKELLHMCVKRNRSDFAMLQN